MRQLFYLKKYFWRYKFRFLFGILFTVLSNYFGILSPQVTKYVINKVTQKLDSVQQVQPTTKALHHKDVYEPIVKKVITAIDYNNDFNTIVIYCGITLLVLALLRGLFTYLMRQTIIVMSRHIEYNQKNDVYQHYQKLDLAFYKANTTGDLMNRISEDVSKVRMFTGPAVMYSINLIALIGLSIFYMFKTNAVLTLFTIAPLPLLAFVIYKVNTIINKKSEAQQQQLSAITATAQESYSGIRVIKAFAKEKWLSHLFEKNSEAYKQKAITLATTEAWYFPSIALLIGISTLLTIMIGGLYKIHGDQSITVGTIAEFVVYINMLTFPVSSIGWVASIIQKASASQKRINEFILQQPNVADKGILPLQNEIESIAFNNISLTYNDTSITALQQLNFTIKANTKVAIVGKTGSGKTTLLQLLLRLYNPTSGHIAINNTNIESYTLQSLRQQIAYIPQEVFLFSDTIYNNIQFGVDGADEAAIIAAAKAANIHNEIMELQYGYATLVGERGVTLSGGQKQRISIARAILKNSTILLLDDCLSAVDIKTEVAILQSLQTILQHKIGIFVTHRIGSLMHFDTILVLHNGIIIETGTHQQLLALQGHYYKLYIEQQMG